MVQPSFKVPTKFFFGTLTESKNVSVKGDLPLINLIGLVETPSELISINKKLIPVCLDSELVLTKQNIKSPLSPYDVQTLDPVTKK